MYWENSQASQISQIAVDSGLDPFSPHSPWTLLASSIDCIDMKLETSHRRRITLHYNSHYVQSIAVYLHAGSTLTATHCAKRTLNPDWTTKCHHFLIFLPCLSCVKSSQDYKTAILSDSLTMFICSVTKALLQLHFQSYKGELLTRILYFLCVLSKSIISAALCQERLENKGAWLARPDFNSSPFSAAKGEEDRLHKDE